ncbi:MAG: helix-turn-helix transcriptional regulator [Clostridiales bacterium]|nr:helix-turn-helix transcriptional regulator [Clostridiales bacterium]
MMRAYNEIYLNDAMQTLAETFSYVPDEKRADVLFQHFVMSGIAHQFGRGNPRYVNMPAQALFNEITDGKMAMVQPYSYSRSPEYWCGFVLAYYQWYTGLGFEQIGRRLPPSRIISMYNPLHEASMEKFVEVANSIVFQKETNLARYRKTANLSQKELANYSNVSIRAIQLYEQRRLDIDVAPAIKLFQISRVLGCNIEDLLETNN